MRTKTEANLETSAQVILNFSEERYLGCIQVKVQ